MKILHAIALIVTLCLLAWLTGCAAYQATVAARSVGVRAQIDEDSATGKIIYTVTYR